MMSPNNTPHRDVGLSPAEIFYAQAIKDHLTILGNIHQIPKRWREMKELREKALAKRHQLNQDQYRSHSFPLGERHVGESVQVQNQHGPYPRR